MGFIDLALIYWMFSPCLNGTGSRKEGKEQLSPITVALVRLAQFLSQTYPGLYVRDVIFRLGEDSDVADGGYVFSKHTCSRLCAGAGIGM